MNEHHPHLVSQTQIEQLHDALAWLTTPPTPDLQPFVRSSVIASDAIPGDLAEVFPDAESAISFYTLIGQGMLSSCQHHLARDQSCLNVSLLRQTAAHGSVRAHYTIMPNKLPGSKLTHNLWRTTHFSTLGRLTTKPYQLIATSDEPWSSHAQQYQEALRAIKRSEEVPGTKEVDALIEVILQDNKSGQRART
jgi:hypothetical protein